MIIKTAHRIQLVEEYYFSKKLKEIASMKSSGIDVINLGIGSPDLSPDQSIMERLTLESNKENAHKYQSYVGVEELRKAFSDWYKSHFQVELNPQSEILPLMGSKEGIMHISMTFLEAGDEVLIPNPGYPAYRATTLLSGAKPVEYGLTESSDWLPDLKALEQKDLSKVKLMWLNYPHMPTGTKANKIVFKKLIDFARKYKILLVNDNPYSFILNDQPLSLLSLEGAKDVALELNSLSKSHNMAGWRIGVLAGKKEYLTEILKFKSNMDSGMFLPVQLAAVEALLLPQSWYDELNEIYKKRRTKVFEIMDLLNCKYDGKQGGMFVWAKIPDHNKDGFELSDELLYKTHVFVTPGGIFGSNGDRYIRISLCAKVEVFEASLTRLRANFAINQSLNSK